MINPNLKLVYCFVIFFLCSCDKNKEVTPNPLDDYWGEVTAMKNGEVWNDALIIGLNHQDSTVRLVHPGLSFNIDYFNNFGFHRESLLFNQIPCKIGKVNITISLHPNDTDLPTSNYFTLLSHGDVVGDVYKIIETEDNFIEIKSMDGNEITATFQVAFHIDTTFDKNNPDAADIIRFEEVFFHTRLKD